MTTSIASDVARNQTGETSAVPSARYIVRTAGVAASSRDRILASPFGPFI